MAVTEFEVVDGADVGAWIEPALSEDPGSVGGTVPRGFDAYVRILHPATDLHGNPLSWRRVAEELGTTVHPTVQWDALVGANRYRGEEPEWPGNEPDQGELPVEMLVRLCAILTSHTARPETCLFGIWMGHWDSHTTFTTVSAGSGTFKAGVREVQPTPAFSSDELKRPFLELPPHAGREYRVLRGSLRLGTEVRSRRHIFFWATPSMIWPEDRAWYMACEIDVDSTLIGGSQKLIEGVLGDPFFEAFPIEPTDSLTWDADHVNPPLLPADD